MADYLLVERKPPRQSTLHRHPSLEQCNTDDAARHTTVDEETAAAFLSTGMAKACEFCEPVPDPPTLDTRGSAP